MRLLTKGEDFSEVPADGSDLPLFSEAILYERLGKGDARFVLGVAKEYLILIQFLGTPAIRALLEQAAKKIPRPQL